MSDVPKEEITIRTERADGEVALRLVGRYHEELTARFPDGFDIEATGLTDTDDVTPPNGAFLIVYSGGRPVGCGAVRKLDDAAAEVKRMWIDPAVRGRGMSRLLLGALEQEARNLGSTVVRLDTNEHLPEAIGLYRSQGYIETQPYNENPYATHWFEKQLS